MIFSDQELTGLENLMSSAGKKGETPHEKRADHCFQKNDSNHHFFWELLAKGIEKSTAPLTNQSELLTHQKHSEKDHLNLIASQTELGQLLLSANMNGSENRSHVSGPASTEIYSALASMVETVERYNMVKHPLKEIPMEAVSAPGTNVIKGESKDKTVYGNGKADIVLKMDIDSEENVLKGGHLLKHSRDNNVDSKLNVQMDRGFSLSGSALRDLSVLNIHNSTHDESISTKHTETVLGKDSKQLEKLFLTRLADRVFRDLNQDSNNTARTAFNLSIPKSQETLLKDKPFMEHTKTDDGLKMVTNPEEKIKNAIETPKVSTLNKSDFSNPGRGQSTPGFSFQIQAAVDMHESINNANSHIKQAEAASDKNMQRTENNVLAQITARLFTGVRQNIPNMIIHLYPPELGKVKVKIVSKKEGLNVHLQSTNNHVVGILGKNLPLLQQSLEDHGIALSDLRVSVESDNQEKSRFEEEKFSKADENVAPKKASPEDLNVFLPQNNAKGWETTQGLSLRV